MKNKEITLKDIAELIIPKIWIIFLVSTLCAGVAFVYSAFFKDDSYTSTSLLYIYSKSSESTEVTTGSVDVAKGMVEVYKVILKSDNFLKGVAQKLEETTEYKDITTDQIRAMMSISQVNDTEIFSVSITAPTSDMALVVLNKIVEYSPERIPNIVPNALNVTILEDPTEAKVPNSKNSVRNAAIVFLLVAVASVFVIWIRSFFNVVIRDKKMIEDNINIPVLGVIPKHEIQMQKGDGKNVKK